MALKSKFKIGDYNVPFDSSGNQLTFAYNWRNPNIKKNYAFETTLKYESYSRGRSAADFEFRDLTSGTTVTFFMSNMSEIIPLLEKGEIKGCFTFVKKGQNFGCKYLGPIGTLEKVTTLISALSVLEG